MRKVFLEKLLWALSCLSVRLYVRKGKLSSRSMDFREIANRDGFSLKRVVEIQVQSKSDEKHEGLSMFVATLVTNAVSVNKNSNLS